MIDKTKPWLVRRVPRCPFCRSRDVKSDVWPDWTRMADGGWK